LQAQKTLNWCAECRFSIEEQLLYRNVQRFRGGLVSKAHRLCVSLNSRLESNKEEEDRGEYRLTRLHFPGAEPPDVCRAPPDALRRHTRAVCPLPERLPPTRPPLFRTPSLQTTLA